MMCGIVDTYNRKLYKKFHAIIWNRSWTAENQNQMETQQWEHTKKINSAVYLVVAKTRLRQRKS